MSECEMCESPVRRRYKLGSWRVCPHCIVAIGNALVARDDREKDK